MQLVFVHCPIFYRLSQRIWSDHDQRLPTNRTVFALFRTTIDKAGRQIIIWYGLPHNNAKGVTQYMNRIYVTGHRNPDTDSIAAAISYAALRNALGNRDYVAAHLGHTAMRRSVCSIASAFRSRSRSATSARRCAIWTLTRRRRSTPASRWTAPGTSCATRTSPPCPSSTRTARSTVCSPPAISRPTACARSATGTWTRCR